MYIAISNNGDSGGIGGSVKRIASKCKNNEMGRIREDGCGMRINI